VFIDCPAGIDIGFLNAIAPAREAIIVTTPEITSIRDADRVAGLLEANGVFNVKLLVNRVRADMIKKNDMMSVRDVQEMLGVPLLGAIPEDTNVIISTNRGEPLVLKKKLTLAGIAYENAGARGARFEELRAGGDACMRRVRCAAACCAALRCAALRRAECAARVARGCRGGSAAPGGQEGLFDRPEQPDAGARGRDAPKTPPARQLAAPAHAHARPAARADARACAPPQNIFERAKNFFTSPSE
jgi:hypothetical protein